ncbi:MAG: Arylesterase [Alphaproteobacteria bacterium MarineAlpha4_Bin2]|nr:MAG: Arylesterase [Alphaproteobacteria bacterium MarineAlpha4_Bin2]
MFVPFLITQILCRPYGEVFYRFNANITFGIFACLFTITPAITIADPVRILALGDSLTAGYGLSQANSFPSQLAKKLHGAGIQSEIINAGVSGDTTSGALQRLDWLIDGDYDLAIIELGANDALRAIDPALTRQNLEKIVKKFKARGTPVLLAGMKAPRNLGPDYTQRFDELFPAIAQDHGLHFYPFFLDGVATYPELNQQDGLHPNAKGVAIIASRMLPFAIDALEKDRK